MELSKKENFKLLSTAPLKFFKFIHSERCHGAVVRVLACGPEGYWIKITFDWVSRKTFSVHPVASGYPTLFRAGEVFRWRRERRRWAPHMRCPLKQWDPEHSPPMIGLLWDLLSPLEIQIGISISGNMIRKIYKN